MLRRQAHLFNADFCMLPTLVLGPIRGDPVVHPKADPSDR